MHVFQVAFYGAGVYYALFIDRAALFPFLAILAIYFILSAILPNAKALSTRKKITAASWSPPSEPNIIGRTGVRVEKVQKLLQSIPKEKRPSMTHFLIKACGQILVNQPSLNGILTLGKFVPYDSVDVSCLCDINNGKDLALICVKGVDKMSVYEIADFIKEKASKMKRSEGGEEHKKQTGMAKLLPAAVLAFIMEVTSFITYKLGISLNALKIPKRAFGAAYITSLGSMGYEDAVAPFTGVLNATYLLASNAIVKKPVVEGDKIVIGQVMQCNFTVDHRYIDGANCAKLIKVFHNIFEEPEKYLDKSNNEMKKQE